MMTQSELCLQNVVTPVLNFEPSLIPRTSLPPFFYHLQYARLQVIKNWIDSALSPEYGEEIALFLGTYSCWESLHGSEP